MTRINQRIDCPYCDGLGYTGPARTPDICPNCEGTGTTLDDSPDDEPSDSDATLGLTDRYAGGSGGY